MHIVPPTRILYQQFHFISFHLNWDVKDLSFCPHLISTTKCSVIIAPVKEDQNRNFERKQRFHSHSDKYLLKRCECQVTALTIQRNSFAFHSYPNKMSPWTLKTILKLICEKLLAVSCHAFSCDFCWNEDF